MSLALACASCAFCSAFAARLAFLSAAARLIPKERRFDDPLSTLAFGTDASFYRLIPKLVIRVESEREVIELLKLAGAHRVPVTFRAAGTSLSGQAISDSVLIVLGDNWNDREIRAGGAQIRLQPGVIGASANAVLAPLQRKIGPDPASIAAAKIGGHFHYAGGHDLEVQYDREYRRRAVRVVRHQVPHQGAAHTEPAPALP